MYNQFYQSEPIVSMLVTNYLEIFDISQICFASESLTTVGCMHRAHLKLQNGLVVVTQPTSRTLLRVKANRYLGH